MKKIILLSSLAVLLRSTALAESSVALVYENEGNVKSGEAVVGAVTADGILITAKMALASNATLMAGLPGSALKKAILLRLDVPADVALLQLGDDVADPALQQAFQSKSQSYLSFMPPAVAEEKAAAFSISTQPYQLKVNGAEIGADPIALEYSHRKAEAKFEIVRLSTTPVWYLDVFVTADPKLSFWKKGKAQTLTDVPMPKFRHSQQMMFKPLAKGKSFVLPLEIYFMEDRAYNLNVVLKSKTDQYETVVPVVFKTKS